MKNKIKQFVEKHSNLLVRLNNFYGRFFMLNRQETYNVNKSINGEKIYNYIDYGRY